MVGVFHGPPTSTARDAQLPVSFSRNCLPGTTLGEAKGTAWPESCWSLVTWAREQGQRLRGGQFRKGHPRLGVTHLCRGHCPILTLDRETLWGQSG